jgi:hypothetical protein
MSTKYEKLLKKTLSTVEIKDMRIADHSKLNLRESAYIRRTLRKYPPEWNHYFTNANLRLIQVMKERKKEKAYFNLKGADAGAAVEGFKGP